MTPHHCRVCGLLLSTWNEREEHRADAAAGFCKPPEKPFTVSPEQAAKNLAALERFVRSHDGQKMLARLDALRAEGTR